MSINPEQKPYLKLTPLRMQCLTNFPFIEADFDALTDYQLFCEIVKYLNNVIKNENVVTDNVIALYNAFMELQSEVESELAKQNQRIDDYFENTNIQAFVDNKINNMIATNEFQTLLADAINEINPDILKNEKRINNLNFGGTLIQDYDLENINNSLFLSSTMKPVILNILNNMKNNNELYYYFVNGDEDTNTMKLFKFDIQNIENGSIYLYVYYLMNYLELDNPSVLWEQNFNVTISNDVITDISIDYENKTTRTLYTGSGGSSENNTPIYYINGTSAPNFTIGSFIISNTDKPKYINMLTDAVSKNYKVIILHLSSGNSQFLLYFDIHNIDLSTPNTECIVGQFYNSVRADSFRAISYTGDTNKAYAYITLQVSASNGVITNITALTGTQNIDKYIGVNNTSAYTPTQPNHPATKGYVDGKSLNYQTGNIPFQAGSDVTILDALSYYSALAYGDSQLQMLYDVHLQIDTTASSLTGDVIVATTPHIYAGFTIVPPSASIVGYRGIAIVYNNSNTPVFMDYYATFNTTSNLWELHLRIPPNVTLTSGASISIHMTYIRATR